MGDGIRVCALLLAAAAAHGLCAGPPATRADLLDPRAGPPTRLPDLATDGAAALSWLPGLGAGRARTVVAGRPRLPAPLHAGRLDAVPGVGPATAADAARALQEWRRAARLEWGDEEGGAGP